MGKEKEQNIEKEVVIYKVVNQSHVINLPVFLIGKEVEIRFKSKLTEEEKKQIELNKLYEELKKIRSKKRKGRT